MTDEELHEAANSFGAPLEEPPPRAPGGGGSGQSPRRLHRMVAAVTGGLLAGWAALSLVAGLDGWWDTHPQRIVAIGLIIVGAGVAIGAILGTGTRFLLPIGILAIIVLGAIAGLGDTVGHGVGERIVRPTVATDLDPEYRLGFGRVELDLTAVDVAELDGRELVVKLGGGEVEVIIPQQLGGSVDVIVGIGEAVVATPAGTVRREGPGIEIDGVQLAGEDAEISLRVEVGFGSVKVTQE